MAWRSTRSAAKFDFCTGHLDDTLAYFLNTGNATAPRFVADATNPFASLDSGRDSSAPTLSDLDGDGTLAPRPVGQSVATARAHRRRFGPGRRDAEREDELL